tara:strand:+ start:3280 stop:3774 length:495 start_codon:yes stop_codon:yes gene_type:complete
MLAFQLYLNSPHAKKVLSKKPGEAGFSLIELVVVVAVLAILAAIAIPSFTSLNAEARVAGAKTTLANLVKECAVKILDSAVGNETYTAANYAPNGYNAVAAVAGKGTTGTCGESDEYTLVAVTVAGKTDLPTFNYNAGTGAKTCTDGTNTSSANYQLGCTSSKW